MTLLVRSYMIIYAIIILPGLGSVVVDDGVDDADVGGVDGVGEGEGDGVVCDGGGGQVSKSGSCEMKWETLAKTLG